MIYGLYNNEHNDTHLSKQCISFSSTAYKTYFTLSWRLESMLRFTVAVYYDAAGIVIIVQSAHIKHDLIVHRMLIVTTENRTVCSCL